MLKIGTTLPPVDDFSLLKEKPNCMQLNVSPRDYKVIKEAAPIFVVVFFHIICISTSPTNMTVMNT